MRLTRQRLRQVTDGDLADKLLRSQRVTYAAGYAGDGFSSICHGLASDFIPETGETVAAQVERRSSALANLARRRRRAKYLGIGVAIIIAAIFSSVQWWPKRVPPPKAGTGTVWRSVVFGAGGYSVSLPGIPKAEKRELKFLTHPLTLYLTQSSPGDITYLVGYTDYPPSALAAFSPEELLNSTRQSYEVIPRGQVVDEKSVAYEQYAGRERKMEAGTDAHSDRAIVRIYLVGSRVYHLATAGAAPFDQLTPEAAKLFGTFRLAADPAAPPPQ